MKLARLVYVVFAILGIAACSAVYVQEPIGTEIVQIDSDDWSGIWVDPDGETFIVGVRDADAGILWLAFFDERDGEPMMESTTAYVRDARYDGHKRMLISIRDWLHDEERYIWGLAVAGDDDLLVVYEPNKSKFRDLIKDGTLPGTVEGESGNVYLGRLEAEHLEMIIGSDDGSFFVWDEPWVLRRVAR